MFLFGILFLKYLLIGLAKAPNLIQFNLLLQVFLARIFLISLFVFTSINTKIAKADIIINEWQEDISLITNGKRVNIKIKAIAANLPANAYHDNFSISFDKRQNIQVKDVKIDGRAARFLFRNNQLSMVFDQRKTNGKPIEISYSYQEKYLKSDEYLRQEFLTVPDFAKNAAVKVSLKIPDSLDVISVNPALKMVDNKLTFEGKVPQTGQKGNDLSEIVRLTPKSSIWDVKIINTLSKSSGVDSLEIRLPTYFVGYGQKIDKNYLVPTIKPNSSAIEGNNYLLKYSGTNANQDKYEFNINAVVYSGSKNQKLIDRNPQDYLRTNHADWFLLEDIIDKIENDPKYKGLPTYVKIGQFVHNYIKYDRSYTGKLLDIKSILSTKKGVCTEYAKLFNNLARIAGIPSITVNGVAKGEYDAFEGHSWNLIYYNNKWISVDPTWNLMNGVTSSHIYFYDDPAKAIDAKWTIKGVNASANINVNLDTKFEVTPAVIEEQPAS